LKLEEVQYKLLGELQSLPPELALEFVRQSLREIYKEHDWSFLYKQDVLRTPALINTGTINVVEYSNIVVPSASLKAILDAILVNDVKLEGRQLRTFGGTVAGSSFIYNIISYDASGFGAITIDPYYIDESNPAANFEIFKNRYTAQEIDIDFAHFEWIAAPFNQRRINLDWDRNYLDSRDPDRTAKGDPYYAVPYINDTSENLLIELYPIPISKRIYRTYFKREGLTLESDDNIPSKLSYELVLAKAKIKAYKWLATNAEKVNDKKSPNVYMNLIAMASNPNMEDSYPALLKLAKVKDDNILPQMLIGMGDWPYYQEVIVETVLMDF
jgi:hypothetical protein